MKPIYLDHAATTPMDPQVLAVMQPFFTDQFYNPSATYSAARSVKSSLDTARSDIAHYIGAKPSELVFTAGGTEANNLAVSGIMELFPDAHLLVSAIEHDSVLMPARKYNHTELSVANDGRIDLESLKASIQSDTVLISIQYANNEIGTIQPLSDIAAIVQAVRRERRSQGNDLPLLFHTDACQAPAYLDIHAARLGIDLMTLNASKIYGPKQIGLLYVKSGVRLQPQILGGGQERGQRSGTENVASIIGFAKALQLVQARRHEESKRLYELQKAFIEQLEQTVPRATVNGSLKHRLVNNIHLTFPGIDNETLMMQLDNEGVICAVGSACSASNEEPSHVLKAIGMTDAEAQSSLRFTPGLSTTSQSIQTVVSLLEKFAK